MSCDSPREGGDQPPLRGTVDRSPRQSLYSDHLTNIPRAIEEEVVRMSADPIGKAHLEKEVERAFREPP